MKDGERKEGLRLAELGVAAWIIWDTVTGLYFGAGFYGIQPPSWITWVGGLNPVMFDVIDSIGLVMLVLVIALSSTRRRRVRE